MDSKFKLEMVEGEIAITQEERLTVYRNMRLYGGRFILALSEALIRADKDNVQRIKDAFPEYWEKYLNMEKEVVYFEKNGS